MPAGSYTRGTFCKFKNRMLKEARNAFNIGEVWNPVCCHGNKTFKLILCWTFSRTLLQRIKHICYKLAEISFFIIFDENLFFIQQKVPRECPWKNVFFRIRNISKRKQTLGKKHAEHCLTHVNKTACEIWSVFDKVHFWVKTLTPFFHRSLQLLLTFSFFQFSSDLRTRSCKVNEYSRIILYS